MNITAHVHFPNLVRFTGHGRVANEIIRGLHSNNNVNLRLYGNAAQYRKIKPQLETIIQNLRQPQTYHLSDRTISKLWLLPDFARFAPKFKDCDVVLSTNQTYIPTGDLPLFVIWYDAQNLEPDLYKSSFGKWRSITALKLLAKRIEQSNSYVITISHFSAARLSHFFPSLKSKIIVSYIGVSDIFFYRHQSVAF